jgi:hypothetical protein
MINAISVRDYGATGDGVTLDTRAIQAAIDACTNMGGGTVYVPPGNYLTGTITLKDNVTFHLGPDARLLGSTLLADYPSLGRPDETIDYLEYLNYCLINADGVHHIALTGEGCVDGQGAAFPYGAENYNFEDQALASAVIQPPHAASFHRLPRRYHQQSHPPARGFVVLQPGKMQGDAHPRRAYL